MTATPNGPRLGSYTDATGSVSAGCGCRIETMPRGVCLAMPCAQHEAQMVVEMRPRIPTPEAAT